MAKYIRRFESINDATSAQDLVSPNLTTIDASTGTKLLMKNTGTVDESLEIKVDPISGEPIIEEKTLIITFIIDGTEYQCVDGMTWGEWVESEYNIDGYYVSNDGVYLDYRGRAPYVAMYVTADETISSTTSYRTSGGSGMTISAHQVGYGRPK